MGLEHKSEGKFITILGGKLCQRVSEGTEGAIQRINKIGNVVWEKFYDSFSGKLISIKIQDSTYGKTWNFGFIDKEEVYTLQLPYSNTFATSILKMLPNVDLEKEMRVTPQNKLVDGKNRSSLFINQDGASIKHAHTKENPNGMPDMEQVTVKGELVWDDTKRIDWLHDMVQKDIVPKLSGFSSTVAQSKADVDFENIGKKEDEINPEEVAF